MCENIWRIMKENKFEIDCEISPKFKCTICDELIIKASNAPCGCRFCFDCIENYLNGNDKFCPGKSKRCQKKMINYKNDISIDNPINNRISEIVVKCPRKNCQFKDELSMIENHMITCEKHPISCPYYEIGCEMNEVMNDDMKDHLNEGNYCHSKLLIELINSLRNEIESIKNENIELRKEKNLFKQEIDKIKLQSTEEKQKICQLERKDRENSTKIEELHQEMKNENRSMKTEIQTNVKLINKLRQIMESNHKGHLKQKDDIEMMKGKINKICEENANFVTRLNYFDKRLKEIFDGNGNNLQIKMIEMETKLKNLEIEEIEGEFVWKLEKLLEKNFQSQQKKDTPIYSNSFYSWKFGYKICLSVNILAFGLNDHIIYVNFHLMRGEFDNNLEWPFTCSVTIDVIGQQKGNIYQTKTQKYSDCPDNVGWKKPSKDRNEGILYHKILYNSPAVRNDQIIIKCKVDGKIKSIYN